VHWELLGSQIGFGDFYKIAFTNQETIKPIKLDGIHVKKLLTNNLWKEAIKILDPQPQTFAVWEVI
jgi:hypothetical protein